MKNLNDFISPCPVKTPPMSVRVIDRTGAVKSTFLAPAGFQLERYVDSLYPENEFMLYFVNGEINVSVLDGDGITEVYVGTYK